MRAPRGFYAVCGSILCGAAAVIALDLAHHGPAAPRVAGPAPRVTVTVSPPVHLVPLVAPATGAGALSGSGAPRPSPSPSGPSPSPSRSPRPSHSPPAGVSVGVAAALRGATPVAVRAAVVAPAAPPFPHLGLTVALF